MKCRTVENERGKEFVLTENEEKYVRAIERLARMDTGRIELFGSGDLSVRIDGCWSGDNIDLYVKGRVICEGGDGGDENPDL